MVRLTLTSKAKAAIDELGRRNEAAAESERADDGDLLVRLSTLATADAIEHADLIQISQALTRRGDDRNEETDSRQWRLESLVRGAAVYQAPPPVKPEPTPEYKALMARLRQDEEQRQYERMLNPVPQTETFDKRFPSARNAFDPALSIGQTAPADEVDEVTYSDVNRQMALIINVLVSIICCSIAIWIAARRLDVPQRLALSMSGSGIVAVAEVAIYMGYIRRIEESKTKERKATEKKEIVETWVLDGKPKVDQTDSVRYRKGKHR